MKKMTTRAERETDTGTGKAPGRKKRKTVTKIAVVRPKYEWSYVDAGRDEEARYETLRAAVGGGVDIIPTVGEPDGSKYMAFANEDWKGLPENMLGSMVLESMGFHVPRIVHGPVAILRYGEHPLRPADIIEIEAHVKAVFEELGVPEKYHMPAGLGAQ
ncbi:MAG: hypothetical protein M0R22_13055 [Dehalococcoidia bacterium]|nr:hypothetical protein [Dehalococcoidia bacterium]